MKYLMVGLGNPGPEYEGTRHNIGFMVLDALATALAPDEAWHDGRYGWRLEAKFRGRVLVLLKPSTYMNLSGKAVRYHLDKEKLPNERLLVITDDIALPFGTLRLKGKGSDGGHNGLANIIQNIGAQYARLRVGVGSEFHKGQQVDYVLSPFANDEAPHLPAILKEAAACCQTFAFRGLNAAMNAHNGSVLPKPEPPTQPPTQPPTHNEPTDEAR